MTVRLDILYRLAHTQWSRAAKVTLVFTVVAPTVEPSMVPWARAVETTSAVVTAGAAGPTPGHPVIRGSFRPLSDALGSSYPRVPGVSLPLAGRPSGGSRFTIVHNEALHLLSDFLS
jgi:hypothetical protein